MTSIKHLANVTAADRDMARRMDQAEAHARQNRTDLLGQCPVYDDTWHYTRDAIEWAEWEAVEFTFTPAA
jgi:hypothetical protein